MIQRSNRLQTVVTIAMGTVLQPWSALYPARAAVVEARIVAAEDDIPDGGGGQRIAALNSPFSNGHGQVAFTGELVTQFATLDSFVWIDDRVVWKNSDAPVQLESGAERSMGISNDGGFVYSTEFDDRDVLISDVGVLAREDDRARGFATTTLTVFHAEATMTPAGRVFWIAEIDGDLDGIPEGRVLYTSDDGQPDSTRRLLAFGDLVEGLPIQGDEGIGLDYQLTDSGHHIHVLILDTGDPANDDALYVDGEIVAQEGSPTGGGDLWENFDLVSINREGDYVFSGNVDGAAETDEFVAHNGDIVLREGDTLDGVELIGSARVRGLALNDLGHSAFLWRYGDPRTHTLFFTCDAADPATAAVALLAEGDELDVDGDGVGELTIVDFNASEIAGPGLSLPERGVLHLEVDVDDGNRTFEAIVELALPSCGDEPSLAYAGQCPGPARLDLSGGTPNGQIVLLTGTAAGSDAIPAGPCAGVETTLVDPTVLTFLAADAAGEVSLSGDLDDALCGLATQALDLDSCRISNFAMTP